MKTQYTHQLLLILFLSLNSVIVPGQIGIDTYTPQGIFHVDGAKNNPDTATPSPLQAADDFVIKSSGNVGIGILTPSSKIEINSGIPNISGVRLTQLTTASIPVSNIKTGILGVDTNGNVIISKVNDPSLTPCIQTFAFVYDDTAGDSNVVSDGNKETMLSKKMDPQNIYSGGNFSLKSGDTYRLEASFFNNYPETDQNVSFSYEWYNETDQVPLSNQNVPRATVFQNNTNDFTGIQPYLLAFITPAKDIQVSIRFRRVEGSSQTYPLKHSYMQVQQINPCTN